MQIHELETPESTDSKTIFYEGRHKALATLLFITEERTKNINDRNITDRHKQRSCDWYDKSDGSFSTVAMDGILWPG